jgi:hypothetical protein
MFHKLDIPMPDLSVSRGDREITKYGLDTDNGFQGILYNDCGPVLTGIAPLLDRIPIQYHAKFWPMYMTINRDILPHIDSGVNTVINVYLESGGYQTDFNSPKEGATPFKIPNQTNGECYQFEDVDVLDSFIAEDGDTYILDVTKLHSVHTGAGERKALALSTLLPYDQVVALLEPLCTSCREPLSAPSGDGCACMPKHSQV